MAMVFQYFSASLLFVFSGALCPLEACVLGVVGCQRVQGWKFSYPKMVGWTGRRALHLQTLVSCRYIMLLV